MDEQSPSDRLNEKLRKAREEAMRRAGETPRKPKNRPPAFVQYGTMFKIEDRPMPAISYDEAPRQLKCVNCALVLEWRIYTIDPETFEKQCPECKMTAREFWKGKLHRETNDA